MGTHNAWVREEGGGRHHQGCLKDHEEGLRREDADEIWRGVEPVSCAQAPLATGTDVLASFYILACLGGKAMSLAYTRLQGG